MNKVKLCLLVLIFGLFNLVAGCSGGGYSENPSINPPSNFIFEETTKGVYLRFDFEKSNKYKYIYVYEVKIFKNNILEETKKLTSELPILEFTDLLRDESLELVFRVKVTNKNNNQEVTQYSNDITYVYDVTKVHYTTAPMVSNVVINENYVIEWDHIEGIKEYEVVLNHYFKDNSKEVIKLKVYDSKLDLSKTILYNDQKLTIQIKALGNSIVGEKHFHSSDLSDEYIVFEVIK